MLGVVSQIIPRPVVFEDSDSAYSTVLSLQSTKTEQMISSSLDLSFDTLYEELSQLEEVATLFEQKPTDKPSKEVYSDAFSLQEQTLVEVQETMASFASISHLLYSSPAHLKLENLSAGGLSCGAQTAKAALRVTRQPPKIYRPRYEKEACQNPKGYLRDDYREPVAIKLDGVEASLTGDVVLSIAVITSSGQAHPTIYPTCFGKTMPRDWVEDDKNRTVMTVLRASEDYEKKLIYLGVKRITLRGIDTKQIRRDELTNFRLKFDITISDFVTGELQSITAETDQIHAVCPGTMTKLRKGRKM